MIIKRHYLVDITEKGRLSAYEQLKTYDPSKTNHLVKTLILEGYDGIQVPGIMRRVEGTAFKGMVAVGFSSPYRYGKGQGRLRVPAFVPKEEIVKTITPYQVLEKPISGRTSCLKALQEVNELAKNLNINLGVWGSSGLEVYTGLPYTDKDSDLDLLIRGQDFKVIEEFYFSLLAISKKYGCQIDPELDLPNGYGVKLAELFMHTTHVLGKSMKGVDLIPKKTILEML